jgi:hypothetical protein
MLFLYSLGTLLPREVLLFLQENRPDTWVAVDKSSFDCREKRYLVPVQSQCVDFGAPLLQNWKVIELKLESDGTIQTLEVYK